MITYHFENHGYHYFLSTTEINSNNNIIASPIFLTRVKMIRSIFLLASIKIEDARLL